MLRELTMTCQLARPAAALALTAALALGGGVAQATPVGVLALTSDPNNLTDPFPAGSGPGLSWLNTDNSAVYYSSNTGAEVFDHYVASSLVTQADGSQVRVFNFTGFTLGSDRTMVLQGSLPAALVASGDITINGTLIVDSGILPGGVGGAATVSTPLNGGPGSGPGGIGGGGGIGPGAHIEDPCCGYTHPAGGGGGGKASLGQQGQAGTLFPSGLPNGTGGLGGNADANPAVLKGGGGGGGGAGYGDQLPGGQGGYGGGAAFFRSAGSITIGLTGQVIADGGQGGANYSGGGGGAGGELWFDAFDAWINDGFIGARGGREGWLDGDNPNGPILPSWGGAGSGGLVWIDPASVDNCGIINVSDGLGGSSFGGAVDSFGTPIGCDGQIIGAAAVTASVPEPGGALAMALPMLLLLRRRSRA